MKNTKIIVLFILLLTVSFALCACNFFGGNDSTDDGGNHSTEYVKDSYEYTFTIAGDEFKYVFNSVYTENDQHSGDFLTLYFNDAVLRSEGSNFSVEGDRLYFNDVVFVIREDKTLAYESGSYLHLPWIVQPYDSLAGTYTTMSDEPIILTLAADGTATYSEAEGISFHYYPLGNCDIALVSDLNNNALIINLSRGWDNSFQHNNVTVGGFTPEFVGEAYDVKCTGKEYWGGEGYFFDCSLYVADGKCLLTGYSFMLFDYTREGNTLTTDVGDLVLDEQANSFDLKLVKRYESKDKSLFINVYEDGYAYSNQYGRCTVAETPEGFEGVAIYQYEPDIIYVFDKELNMTALILDSEYVDVSAMKKYTDANNQVICVNDDMTKIYHISKSGGYKYDEIYAYDARKLQENILFDGETCYFLFDNNFVACHYGNLQYYSRIESATESIVQKIGVQTKWTSLDGNNDSCREADDHTVCATLRFGNGDILIIELNYVTDLTGFSETLCEDAVKVGDYYTDGKVFIKLGEEMIEVVEYGDEIDVDAVKDYSDGYITVVSRDRNFLFDIETAEYVTCIEEAVYAGFEGKEFTSVGIINSDLSKIYVYSGPVDNVAAYAPAELTAVPQIEGLYSYVDSIFDVTRTIFVKRGETNEYYTTNWNPVSNVAAPSSVDTYLGVKRAGDDENSYTVVICHYGDHSEIYAYTVLEDSVWFHSGYGYSGAYAYDEASDTVTVTYEYSEFYHYVHTITNAKKTNPDEDTCYSIENVQVNQ